MIKTVEKPWGKEELLEHNDKYVLKRITMNAGHRCSLQYHEYKRETVYVEKGVLKLIYGNDKSDLKEVLLHPGEPFTLDTKVIHRMEAVDTAVYLEASTPELDDVVRLNDDYNR